METDEGAMMSKRRNVEYSRRCDDEFTYNLATPLLSCMYRHTLREEGLTENTSAHGGGLEATVILYHVIKGD